MKDNELQFERSCHVLYSGPCKKEIPFLKELEKKFEGKNITFLSLSTDQNKQDNNCIHDELHYR